MLGDLISLALFHAIGLAIGSLVRRNSRARRASAAPRAAKLAAPVPVPVAALQPGRTAMVVGAVGSVAEPLAAPHSGAPCACYALELEGFYRVEATGERHAVRARAVRCAEFVLVEDGGASIAVAPGEGPVTLSDAPVAHAATVNAREGLAPEIAALLDRHAPRVPGVRWDLEGGIEVRERRVGEGDVIAVEGRAESRGAAAAAAHYRAAGIESVLRARRVEFRRAR